MKQSQLYLLIAFMHFISAYFIDGFPAYALLGIGVLFGIFSIITQTMEAIIERLEMKNEHLFREILLNEMMHILKLLEPKKPKKKRSKGK